VAHFEGDQGTGGEYHQKFGPPLLQVNANAFSEENRGIEKAKVSSGAQKTTARESSLQAVEQKMHCFAVLEQDFVGYPVRKVIHPNSARIQKQNRNSEHE